MDTIRAALVVYQPEDEATMALKPLLEGKTAILTVYDQRIIKKRRVGTPVLVIQPAAMHQLDKNSLLFSMPGYGSELVPISGLKASILVRMGLSIRSAQILITALKTLFLK